MIEGQINLRDAVRRTIAFADPRAARPTGSNEQTADAASCARAAGTCPRSTCCVDGEPISGVALRLRPLLLPQRARRCSRAAPGPYFYLPKMESHLEARLWNDVFVARAGRARHPARHDQGDGADRDASSPRSRWTRSSTSCASTRRASTAAAGTTSSASSRSSATDPDFVPARPRAGHDDDALPARLRAAADQDLPPPRRPRDGRHGGADPDQERRRRRTRRRSPRCAPTRSARCSDGHDGTWVAHPGLVPIAQGGLRRA